MSLERWETYIRTKPGREDNSTSFISDFEEIAKSGGVAVRYLVVAAGDSNGLVPGVYIETNVTPKGFMEDPIQNAIALHVTVDLVDRSAKAPSIGGDTPFITDFASAIEFQPVAVAQNGAIVLRLESPREKEARDRIRDVELGSSRMGFISNPPTP